MAIVGAEYVLRLVPRGTHDINKFIKPAELLGWMDDTRCASSILSVYITIRCGIVSIWAVTWM
ncbi:Ubiquinone biosynthesis O-methyltransferase, mitochondrial [Sodalis praecaptivus]